MAHALASPIDADLKRLLALRRNQLLEHDGYDLGELVHIVVAEPRDTLATIEGVVGVPLSTNLMDGIHHGEPGFTANFEYVARHGRWFEAVLILSDDGFGVVLFVPDHPNVDASLLALVRDHN
ncbi:hypothetical protein V6U71_05650 [Sphingopyxis sp. J-6]|uniref:hypothetical protein n=1 Tax=Sphingopyxis sp. J-6 TaxID=3122054 RepID=UPI003983E2F1